MEIRETLRCLLENQELQEALGEAFATGTDLSVGFSSVDLAVHIQHARGIDVSETPFEDLPATLTNVIESLVIERLPQPAPITLDDLTSLAISHLAGVELSDGDAWSKAYSRFVAFALSDLAAR